MRLGMIVMSFQDLKFRGKKISPTFSYFLINNALLQHFLANLHVLAHNKKTTEKSVFRFIAIEYFFCYTSQYIVKILSSKKVYHKHLKIQWMVFPPKEFVMITHEINLYTPPTEYQPYCGLAGTPTSYQVFCLCTTLFQDYWSQLHVCQHLRAEPAFCILLLWS